ncbi:MAG: methyltransferase domain-containing protein [Armatimonadetes bacterium]|nr:methyltransferase domain-containing protein [Armatimonadota bacterium]
MGEVDRQEFWEALYRSATDRWDLGGPTPQFSVLFGSPGAPAPGHLIVPGCGRGHDAILFARHGFDVVGVDFAAAPLEAARREAAHAGVRCSFVQCDLFALPPHYAGAFDYLLEYTCYCAIDPARRPEYVEVAARLLRPGGELIGLFFPMAASGQPTDGPPFPIFEEEIRALFAPRFALEVLEPAAHSIQPRSGREMFARFRRL